MSAERRPGSLVAQVKFVAVLVVIVLVLIVIFQNVERTKYDVLFWHAELPRYLLPLIAFLTGALAGGIALHLLRRR
ncbi:MAG: LapA family protein [Candidatus Brocadiaceae bacterium]|jgi:uncharacterized integral membrane protein